MINSRRALTATTLMDIFGVGWLIMPAALGTLPSTKDRHYIESKSAQRELRSVGVGSAVMRGDA
jgi:hypothetical protein